MKSEKRRKFGKALIFAVLFATLAFVSIGCASAATHYVNPGESIQAAVDAAGDGDTIEVASGTYYENVVVNKQLTLRGIGMPVVDAGGSESAITVSANGCRIKGFAAIGNGSYRGDAGIKITSDSNMILNNNASNNVGIYLCGKVHTIVYLFILNMDGSHHRVP